MNNVEVGHVEVFNGEGFLLEAFEDGFFDFVSPLDVVHNSMVQTLESRLIVLVELFSDLVDVADG